MAAFISPVGLTGGDMGGGDASPCGRVRSSAALPLAAVTRWSAIRWLATCIGLSAAAYATYVAVAWFRYGHPAIPVDGDVDRMLDGFMPTYDVVDRHRVMVAAPAAVTLQVASEWDIRESPVVRALFHGRAMILRTAPDDAERPRAVVEWMRTLGWEVLSEIPGREIVLGIVQQPWAADATPKLVSAAEFAGFHEPGYVKIVAAFRSDPAGLAESVFRLETRAVATDPTARTAFRRYWSFLSPGIVLIGSISLGPLKREAERRARAARALTATGPEDADAMGDRWCDVTVSDAVVVDAH
jgi:hypothetical protein